MQSTPIHRDRFAPFPPTDSAVASLFMCDRDDDAALVAIPRPEVDLIIRFSPSAKDGLDAHAIGARERAHRKVVRGGMRTVTARLRLRTQEAVLGVRASELAGRIVPLEDLWGYAATQCLLEQISAARARDPRIAAFALEKAIAERVATANGRHAPSRLVLHAVERLANDTVIAIARDLGVSDRHLRRVFHDAVGISPKVFAKLTRFHRAIRAGREEAHASWGSIAVAAGYYDQAHLIAEFRALAGVTPPALLNELRQAAWMGAP